MCTSAPVIVGVVVTVVDGPFVIVCVVVCVMVGPSVIVCVVVGVVVGVVVPSTSFPYIMRCFLIKIA